MRMMKNVIGAIVIDLGKEATMKSFTNGWAKDVRMRFVHSATAKTIQPNLIMAAWPKNMSYWRPYMYVDPFDGILLQLGK